MKGSTEATLKAEFIRFSPMVFSVALRILKSKEDAEDVVQEVFTHKLPRILAEEGALLPENLGPLLARVARNQAIDVYRRRKHFSSEEPEDTRIDETPDNPFARVDAMEQTLAELEPHHREVLTLKYLLRLGWVEVAERIGLSVQGARKRAEKAKDTLRERMISTENDGGDA
jgi:RNA polymerase sigma-70 factor, ECF subfamily